jgi:hypothetical protein
MGYLRNLPGPVTKFRVENLVRVGLRHKSATRWQEEKTATMPAARNVPILRNVLPDLQIDLLGIVSN